MAKIKSFAQKKTYTDEVIDRITNFKQVADFEKKKEIIDKIRKANPSRRYKAKRETTLEELNNLLSEAEAKASEKAAKKETEEKAKAEKEEAAAVLKEKQTLKYAEGLVNNEDMRRSFSLNVPTSLPYVMYREKNSDRDIDSIGVACGNTFVRVTVPNIHFNAVHIKTEQLQASTLQSGWLKVTKENRYANGKKLLEVIDGTDGTWHVKLVQPNDKKSEETKEEELSIRPAGKENDTNTKYPPNTAQNTTIRTLKRDVLVSHAPGKGKTFTALLKAEKQRNEWIQTNGEGPPRILIVAPKASILSQWQDEVIQNGFDPRHYIFQTNTFFRQTFTTGRYPKWSQLDQTSKDMINKTCWQGKEPKSWRWEGVEVKPKKGAKGNEIYEYQQQLVKDGHTHFVPPLKVNPKKPLTRYEIKKLLNPPGKGISDYMQDTLTNKYLNKSIINPLGEYFLMDEWKMTKTELELINIFRVRPDLMRLYQEDIFIHVVENEGYDQKYDIAGTSEDYLNWQKQYDKAEREQDYKTLDKLQKKSLPWWKGYYWIFTNLKLGSYLTKKKQEDDQGDLEDGDNDDESTTKALAKTTKTSKNSSQVVIDFKTALMNYKGLVPFEGVPFKAELREDSTMQEKNDAYDPTRLFQFLAGRDAMGQAYKFGRTREVGMSKPGVSFKIDIPKDLRLQAQNSLYKKYKKDHISPYDPFREFKLKLLGTNIRGQIEASVIDKFVNPTHGKDLSQHRYQAENRVIFILDEAHEGNAITDNLYKASTRVIFNFSATTISNIFVTATPMQSDTPDLQLWCFAQLLKRGNEANGKSYEEIQAVYLKDKAEIEAEILKKKKKKLALRIRKHTFFAGNVPDELKIDKLMEQEYSELMTLNKRTKEIYDQMSSKEKNLLSKRNRLDPELRDISNEEGATTLQERAKKRRMKKYENEFKVIRQLSGMVSRAFEMQPVQKRLFLDSVLSDQNFAVEAFTNIIKLHLWNDDKNLDYFDAKLKNEDKLNIIRSLGDELIQVKADNFENSFPTKMRLLTPFDKGRMRVEMDTLRQNICRYAYKDAKILFDYTTRRELLKGTQYDVFRINQDDQEQYEGYAFNKELSQTLYEGVCQRRIIPLVAKPCYHHGEKENEEVTGRFMKRLQERAFNLGRTEGILVVPLLAGNEAEAIALLDKHLLRNWKIPSVTGKRSARKKNPIRQVETFIDECIKNMEEFWNEKKEDLEEKLESLSRTIKSLKRLDSKDLKEKEDEINNLKKKIQLREKFQWKNIHCMYNVKWLKYGTVKHGDKTRMAFIPRLMSSKYKAIVKLMLDKDKDHINGIVYHKTYQVHDHLSKTMEAYGAKKLNPVTITKYDDFVKNAVVKILNKWVQYERGERKADESNKFHLHANKQEGRDEGTDEDWTPYHEIQRLKNWGYNVNEEEYLKQEELLEKGELNEDEEDTNLKLSWAYHSKPQDGDFKSRHYKSSVDMTKEEDMLHEAIREVGRKVEAAWFDGWEKPKQKVIEYIKYYDKEHKHVIKKVIKLNKPITINEYGRYYGEDDEEETKESWTKEYDNKGLIMYEGRNGENNKGPSNDFDGQVFYPATEFDYNMYLTQLRGPRYRIKKINEWGQWVSKYVGENHYRPSLGKMTLLDQVRTMLRFSMTSYEPKDENQLDERVKEQETLMALLDEVAELRIQEFYDNSTVNDTINLYQELLTKLEACETFKTYDNTEKEFEFNKSLNAIVIHYLEISLVVDPYDYVEKYSKGKDREFISKIWPGIKKSLKERYNTLKKLFKTLEDEEWSTKNLVVRVDLTEKEFIALQGDGYKIEGNVVQQYNEQQYQNAVVDAKLTLNRGGMERYVRKKLELFNNEVKDIPKKLTKEEKKMKKNKDEYKKKWEEAAIKARRVYIPISIIKHIQKSVGDEEQNITKQDNRWKYLKGVKDKAKDKYNAQRDRQTVTFSKNPTLENLEKLMEITHKAASAFTWKMVFSDNTTDELLDNKGRIRTEELKDVKYTKVIPETINGWFHRNGIEGDWAELDEDNFKLKATNNKQSFYPPYYNAPNHRSGLNNQNVTNSKFFHENNNATGAVPAVGLRVQTIPSNEKMEETQKMIYDRMRALDSKTFLSYTTYTGQDPPKVREMVKQLHESGLIDYIIMSDAGKTGVDFQSTRRSIMILVQPGRSPGSEDQFVGRLVRNVSHGIIPKLFQRVEYVTFYNSVKPAKTGGELSSQIMPFADFNDFDRIQNENRQQLMKYARGEAPMTEDEKKLNEQMEKAAEDKDYKPDEEGKEEEEGEEEEGEETDDDEEELEDYETEDDDDNQTEGKRITREEQRKIDAAAGKIGDDEEKKEEEVAMNIDEILEGNMLYARTPRKSGRKRKARVREGFYSEEELKALEKQVDGMEQDEKNRNDEKKKDGKEKAWMTKKIAKVNAMKISKLQPAVIIAAIKVLLHPYDYNDKDIFEAERMQKRFGNNKKWKDIQIELEEAERAEDDEEEANYDDMQEDDDADDKDDVNPVEPEPEKTPTRKVVKEAKQDGKKKQRIGGKLHRVVDYHIDNHVNISAVVCVGKLIGEEWKGNHVFSTVKQFLNSPLETVYDFSLGNQRVEQDLLVPTGEKDGTGEFATATVDTREIEKKIQVLKTNHFGMSCYVCHWENSFDATECAMCKKPLNPWYYKMAPEYPRAVQIGNSEVARTAPRYYPERRDKRWKDLKGIIRFDTWSRDENMMWNFNNGFDYNLAQRDKLQFLLSMVTVERLFKQKYDQILKYAYNNEDGEGKMYIRRQIKEPYGLDMRGKDWKDIIWPEGNYKKIIKRKKYPNLKEGVDEGSKTSEDIEETKDQDAEVSDLEFEYLSELESDVESEYSD